MKHRKIESAADMKRALRDLSESKRGLERFIVALQKDFCDLQSKSTKTEDELRRHRTAQKQYEELWAKYEQLLECYKLLATGQR